MWRGVKNRAPLSKLELRTLGRLAHSQSVISTAKLVARQKETPWPESVWQLYRPSERRLSAKLVPTSVDRGCHVVRVTDPYGRILGFLDRRSYLFFRAAPQLWSWGWVNPVPDPVLLRKSGSTGNRTRTPESVARNSDHYRGGLLSST
jgi:hypothetical protein